MRKAPLNPPQEKGACARAAGVLRWPHRAGSFLSDSVAESGPQGQWQASRPFLTVDVANSPTYLPSSVPLAFGTWDIFTGRREGVSIFLYHSFIHSSTFIQTNYGHGTGVGVGGEGQGIVGPCFVEVDKVEFEERCHCGVTLGPRPLPLVWLPGTSPGFSGGALSSVQVHVCATRVPSSIPSARRDGCSMPCVLYQPHPTPAKGPGSSIHVLCIYPQIYCGSSLVLDVGGPVETETQSCPQVARIEWGDKAKVVAVCSMHSSLSGTLRA